LRSARIVVLVLLAALAGGCGGGNGDGGDAAATQGRTTSPAHATTPHKEQSKASPAGRVEEYLRKTFGPDATASADWYGNVKAVSVAGARTKVETNLPDDRDGRRTADQICQDLRGSIPGVTDSVRVETAGGAAVTCVP
jgi:hypothetical protein